MTMPKIKSHFKTLLGRVAGIFCVSIMGIWYSKVGPCTSTEILSLYNFCSSFGGFEPQRLYKMPSRTRKKPNAMKRGLLKGHCLHLHRSCRAETCADWTFDHGLCRTIMLPREARASIVAKRLCMHLVVKERGLSPFISANYAHFHNLNFW